MPSGARDENLLIHVPRFAGEIEVWRENGWRRLTTRDGEERDARIDPESIVHGFVHGRVAYDPSQLFEFGNGDILTISQPDDDEGDGDSD